MSKIRLHGSSSGYMEIAPPAAGSSATVTLPNSAGEMLLSDGSAASLTQIPAANIVGVCTAGLANASGILAGVTMIDSWVVTTTFDQNGASDITANWAKHTAGGSQFGDIGDDMTESSGIFTFPKTGIYMVHHTMSGRADGGARSYAGMRQYYSTNSGGSYTNTSSGYSSCSSGTDHFVGSGTAYYDVTDVSTHRIKFNVETSGTCKFFGNATNKNTGVVFMRLGDT